MKRTLVRSARGLCASLLAAGLSGGAQAQVQKTAQCFNDSGDKGRIGVWIYEGFEDWREARKGDKPTLVFSFRPGKPSYPVKELEYCFLMPGGNSTDISRCTSGELKITRVAAAQAVEGRYDFKLQNGASKSLAFKADYCPQERPVPKAAPDAKSKAAK